MRGFIRVHPCPSVVPLAFLFLAAISTIAFAEEPGPTARWEYFSEVPLPDDLPAMTKWQDVQLTPAVFDAARSDLGDLRLFDATGREVPYAVRVRRRTDRSEELAAREFNRSPGADLSAELTLDLGPEAVEHNSVVVVTKGQDFRRSAIVEGSADNRTWRKLVEGNLLSFQANGRNDRLTYPPSRFRYLRIRVSADPVVDKEVVEIERATVFHKVLVPGVDVTLQTTLGEREAVRAAGGPGSAWVIELGGRNQPVESVEVEIADSEYARDYAIEMLSPEDGYGRTWTPLHSGTWQRRAGQPAKLQRTSFGEVLADKLRLVITDHRNPPLSIRSVMQVAPARELIFARSDELKGPLRLYFGNPHAELPHYDLERNLPADLKPSPARVNLGTRQDNPEFIPAPKPLTERLPWLIYLVLGGASAVLAAVIAKVGRRAIEVHDAAETAAAT